MLTYQLQERTLYSSSGEAKKVSFPVEAEIYAKYRPAALFGVGEEPTRTWVKPDGAKVSLDLFTGRLRVSSMTPLCPLEIEGTDDQDYRVEGNVVTVQLECQDHRELEGVLTTLAFVLPPLFTAELGEPVVTGDVGGRLGGYRFIWGLVRATPQTIITDQEHQEANATLALEHVASVVAHRNRRVLAGLFYYQTACRLLHAGTSIYEFLGEAILNYTKMLQALFGNSRDDVRAGLETLGFDQSTVESSFIPMMVLRNAFDSGHVLLAGVSRAERRTLSRYVENAQYSFARLTKRVLEAVESGSLKLPEYTARGLDSDRKAFVNALRAMQTD